MVPLAPDIAIEIVSPSRRYGKELQSIVDTCAAKHAAGVTYVVMLNPDRSTHDERVTPWGSRPVGFPTVWDDVLDP